MLHNVFDLSDINGNGFDDVIVGADGADPNGEFWAGESYVVFGHSGISPASINLSSLDGMNGFILTGIDRSDLSGASVSGAGDVNGDGLDDLLIGAPGSDHPSGSLNNGESYVVFGRTGTYPAVFNLATLDGDNGFVLRGIDGADVPGVA